MKKLTDLLTTIECMKHVVEMAIKYPNSEEQKTCAESDLDNLIEIEDIIKKYYEW